MGNKYKNLHIRMDSEVKQRFTNVLEQMGLNPSTAINMFARLVIQEEALPFTATLNIDDQIIEEARQATEEIGKDSFKRGISEMTMDEINAVVEKSRKERRESAGTSTWQ